MADGEHDRAARRGAMLVAALLVCIVARVAAAPERHRDAPARQPLLARLARYELTKLQHTTAPDNSVRLSFKLAAGRVELELAPARDLLADSYKEVRVDEHGAVTEIVGDAATRQLCLFRGHVSGAAPHTTRVHADTCNRGAWRMELELDGGARRAVLESAGPHLAAAGMFELAAAKGDHHVYYETTDLRDDGERHTCGVIANGVHDVHEIAPRLERIHNLSAPHFAPQRANECSSWPNKFVDLLIVNDNLRFSGRGLDTEAHTLAVFNFMNTYYAALTGGALACSISLRLAGQLTFARSTPSEIRYRACNAVDPDYTNRRPTTDPCCTGNAASCPVEFPSCDFDSAGYGDDVCYNDATVMSTSLNPWFTFFNVPSGASVASSSGSEVDAGALLRTFSFFAENKYKSQLETLFGRAIDVSQLFTSADFASETVGLTWLNTTCSELSVGIVQASLDFLPGYVAAIASHEMGHNFGLTHNTLMMSNSSSSTSWPTTWSSASQTEANLFLNAVYGIFYNKSTCLETDTASAAQQPRCGNGIVEGDEECDSAWSTTADSCCNANNCTLRANCACSNLDPCCNNGVIRAAGTLCRTAVSSCDFNETCDGVRPTCPVDLFRAPGTACTSSRGFSGHCYNKQCVSVDDYCAIEFGTGSSWCDAVGQTLTCSNILCINPANTSLCFFAMGTADGAAQPCSAGKFCFRGSCQAPSALKLYQWSAGAWGTCSSNSQSRSVVCVDETGITVADANCVAAMKPSSNGFCNCTANSTGSSCQFSYVTGAFGSCESDCQRRRAVFCFDSSVNATVADSNCQSVSRPASATPCTGDACDPCLGVSCANNATCALGACNCTGTAARGPRCEFSYAVGAFGPCNASCGTNGTRTRSVSCVNSTGSPAGSVAVDAAFCLGLAVPSTTQACSGVACADPCANVTCGGVGTCSQGVCTCPFPNAGPSCELFWHLGAYAGCNASCGGVGTETRAVQCRVTRTNATVPDANCTGTPRPASQRSCSGAACADPCSNVTCYNGGTCVNGSCACSAEARGAQCEFGYVTGPWSGCNAACDSTGNQTRSVACRNAASGATVAASNCQGLSVPATAAACLGPACVDPCATVNCGGYGRCVSGACQCDAGFTGPRCNLQFAATAWGSCSALCGGGLRNRSVFCVDIVSGLLVPLSNCSALGPAPATSEPCNQQSCILTQWIALAWGPCSARCGGGRAVREVFCSSDGGASRLADSACLFSGPRPDSETTCNTLPCEWSVGPWGPCPVACNGGQATRSVTCVNRNTGAVESDAALCGLLPRPADRGPCNTDPCFWFTGVWSACSAKCGAGFRTRTLCCLNLNSNQCVAAVNATALCGLPSPGVNESCNTLPCVWAAGPWGACSLPCGGGSQMRAVTCVNPNAAANPGANDPSLFPPAAAGAAACNASARPNSTQQCNDVPCDRPFWLVGPASNCSVECGVGVAPRSVVCIEAGFVAPDSRCAASGPKPDAFESCSRGPCDPCAGVTCLNGGQCRSAGNGAAAVYCACRVGFSGPRCELAPRLEVTAPAAPGRVLVLGSGDEMLVGFSALGPVDRVSVLLLRQSACARGPASVGVFCVPQLVLAHGLALSSSSEWSPEFNSFKLLGATRLAMSDPAVVAAALQPGSDYFVRVWFTQAVIADSPVFTLAGDCPERVCENGGVCASGRCLCTAGFAGRNCESRLCDGVSCRNGGNCVAATGLCNCTGLYRGANCEVPPSCTRTCLNGGQPNAACDRCVCAGGFSGGDCSACALNCSNGGVADAQCVNCVCPDGFTGPRCSRRERRASLRMLLRFAEAAANPTAFMATVEGDLRFALTLPDTDDRVAVRGIAPGSVIAELLLRDATASSGDNRTGDALLSELEAMAQDPSSALYRGVATSNVDAGDPFGGGGGGGGGGSSSSSVMVIAIVVAVAAVLIVAAVILILWRRRAAKRSKSSPGDRSSSSWNVHGEPVERGLKIARRSINLGQAPLFASALPAQPMRLASLSVSRQQQQLGRFGAAAAQSHAAEVQMQAVGEGGETGEREPGAGGETASGGDAWAAFAESEDPAAPHPWRMYKDAGGTPYYFNVETQTSTWERPY